MRTHLILALGLACASQLQAGTPPEAAAVFKPGTSGSEIITGGSHKFDFAPGILHSDDLSDWTPALNFDAAYALDKADQWPQHGMSLRFSAIGTVALDPDLNRDPLKASIDLYYMVMPGYQEAMNGALDPPVLGEKPRTNPALLELGLSGSYETDQSLDHSNGVASAYVRFLQPLGNTWRGLLPSVTAAFDGVFPNEDATADAMNISRDSHARVRAAADWVLRFSVLTDNAFLSHLYFHASAQYTKEFGPPAGWETAGLDEAFGAYTEIAYNLSTGVDAVNGQHTSPLTVFARTTFGRIAPITDDDRGLLIGMRYSF